MPRWVVRVFVWSLMAGRLLGRLLGSSFIGFCCRVFLAMLPVWFVGLLGWWKRLGVVSMGVILGTVRDE